MEVLFENEWIRILKEDLGDDICVLNAKYYVEKAHGKDLLEMTRWKTIYTYREEAQGGDRYGTIESDMETENGQEEVDILMFEVFTLWLKASNPPETPTAET